jgi:hypothetical protein
MLIRGDLEKKEERKANAWYDSNTPHLRTKLNLHGRRGWPDQCYWLPGRPLLIEYKAVGEAPRRLQAHIHTALREAGYEIQTHETAESAIAAIRARLATVDARAVSDHSKS